MEEALDAAPALQMLTRTHFASPLEIKPWVQKLTFCCTKEMEGVSVHGFYFGKVHLIFPCSGKHTCREASRTEFCGFAQKIHHCNARFW